MEEYGAALYTLLHKAQHLLSQATKPSDALAFLLLQELLSLESQTPLTNRQIINAFGWGNTRTKKVRELIQDLETSIPSTSPRIRTKNIVVAREGNDSPPRAYKSLKALKALSLKKGDSQGDSTTHDMAMDYLYAFSSINDYTGRYKGVKEAWIDFCRHRKGLGKPLTKLAAKRLIAKIMKYSNDPEYIIDIISRSIENHWTGIYPDKDYVPKSNGTSSKYVNSTQSITSPINKPTVSPVRRRRRRNG